MARRSHKKRRTVAVVEPSAAFLAALEQQRANAGLRARQEVAEPSEAPPEPQQEQKQPQKPQERQLAGFYFDESAQRYFRQDPRRKRARGLKICLVAGGSASSGVAVATSRPASGRRRGLLGVLAPVTSLQAALDRRQQCYGRLGESSGAGMLKPLAFGRLFVRWAGWIEMQDCSNSHHSHTS